MTRRPLALPLSLLPVLVLGACAEDARETGTVRLALTAEASHFRLRIFEGVPAALSSETVFDTGCLQQQARTYELSNIPVGDGYTVVYEGFASAGCGGTPVALGYRGAVSITAAEQPYYHLQVYPGGAVATLPEDINLSAATATAVEFCDDASGCAAQEVCFDTAAPEYWCVKSCTADADCRGLHVRGACDRAAGWCVLRTPFPLNLSEPRAFGAAATLADGDVLLVGGWRQDGVGNLLPTMYPLERFDAQSGLFVAQNVGGAPPAVGGDFGFAALSPTRVVTVGGFDRARVEYSAGEGLAFEVETADVSDDVIVWDLASGAAGSASLARAVARPTVVPLAADRFFVAGGLVVSGPGLEATRATSLCTVSDGQPSCAPGPTMQHPRQGAAATCLDDGCQQVLLVGGNPTGSLAEIVDVGAGTAVALATTGLPDRLYAPVLCGLDLVGGSTELARAKAFQPVRLAIDAGTLAATPIAGSPAAPFLAAVAGASARSGAHGPCHLAGGLEVGGPASSGSVADTQVTSARLVLATPDGVTQLGPTLGRARFGAVAARIEGGLLAGRVLFAGGMALAGDGPARVVRGAEVLSP